MLEISGSLVQEIFWLIISWDTDLAAAVKAKQQWLKNIKVDFSLMNSLSRLVEKLHSGGTSLYGFPCKSWSHYLARRRTRVSGKHTPSF